MGTYRISEDAKADLTRIYIRGLREYGEDKADKYYTAFFERFEQIAEQPYLYQEVHHIRKGYRRSVCGVDSIYYRVKDSGVEIMSILGRQDIRTIA